MAKKIRDKSKDKKRPQQLEVEELGAVSGGDAGPTNDTRLSFGGGGTRRVRRRR